MKRSQTRGMMSFATVIFGALVASAPSARAANAAIDPAAARLFERAAKVCGEAQTLTLDYRTTSDSAAIPAAESGSVWWRKPKLYAQSWSYSAGQGHFAADDRQILFTDVDGQVGRRGWSGEFGFWTSLPWPLPGHLEPLLRGQKISTRGARLRALPSQKIEGVWCDGALLDLRAVNGDTIRFWFARKTGLLMRESWAVRLPDSAQVVQLQTRYFNIKINPKLERSDFVRSAEETAPLVAPDSSR